MYVNMLKANKRNLIDVGDLRSILMEKIISDNTLDKPTLKTIIELLKSFEETFDVVAPEKAEITPVDIADKKVNECIEKSMSKNTSSAALKSDKAIAAMSESKDPEQQPQEDKTDIPEEEIEKPVQEPSKAKNKGKSK